MHIDTNRAAHTHTHTSKDTVDTQMHQHKDSLGRNEPGPTELIHPDATYELGNQSKSPSVNQA